MKYLHQFVTTNLNVGGGIDDSQTTGIVLQSLNNIDATKPSVACLTWADPLDTSVAEWITYTSVNSTTNELQGVTRGAEGYSAKSHLNQAVIAFPLSKSHVNDLNTAVSAEHSTAGVHSVSAMISGGSVLDEDNMASNSATALATQQSIKAYVDTERVVTTTDDATAVIDCTITDQYQLSAVANATEFTVTGTPTDGQKLIIRFKDAGVAKALTFTGFTAMGVTIPTTTTAGKWGYVGAIYNSAASTWHVVATGTEV